MKRSFVRYKPKPTTPQTSLPAASLKLLSFAPASSSPQDLPSLPSPAPKASFRERFLSSLALLLSNYPRKSESPAPKKRASALPSLSWAGILLFCSSCSMNNSFQDGCLGSIRISVPDSPESRSSRSATSRAALAKRASPSKSSSCQKPPCLIAQMPSHVSSALTTPSPSSLEASPSSLRKPLQRSALSPPALDEWSPPSSLPVSSLPASALSAPSLSATSLPAAPTALPFSSLSKGSGLFPRFQAAASLEDLLHAEIDLPKVSALAEPTRIHVLVSRLYSAIWQERPAFLRACSYKPQQNSGWGRFHTPQSTASWTERCERGIPLSQGQRWHVIDDTFAASQIQCRLFFSSGRLAVIADCGDTLYRAGIRDFSSCLQTGQGCEAPHLRLAKLPPYNRQAIEIPRETLPSPRPSR